MTGRELMIVRDHIKSIYATWHGCALKASEIQPEDVARGLYVGMLCDDCNRMIIAHLKDIQAECKNA